ncbi:UPF0389 domain containing -like, partial [Asbolus verrucosus]
MTGIFSNLLIKTQNFLGSQNTNICSVRAEHSKLDGGSHKVNNLEKKFLVWTGKYKSVEEVPAYVQQNVVERARNRMRIKISNYMMALTVVGCIVMVYFGKRAAGRGESVVKENLEWHRKINEEGKKEK